jgi:hypothetical protein
MVVINQRKILAKQDRKHQQAIHNEKMNGTLVDVIDYPKCHVVSSKDELIVLIQDDSRMSKLSMQ